MLGAIINGVSSLVGGALNSSSQNSANKTNLTIAREANVANQQLQNSQNSWNLQQWNRENAYNAPDQQMSRYQEAGINPYFALGNISSGNAPSLESAPYTPTQRAEVQSVRAGDAVTAGVNSFINTQLATEMNKANVLKARAEAESALASAHVATVQADKIAGPDTNKVQADINLANSTSALQRAQTSGVNLQNALVKEYGSSQKAAEIQSIVNDAALKLSSVKLNDANIIKIGKEADEILARTRNLNWSTTQSQRLLPYVISNMIATSQNLNSQSDLNRITTKDKAFDYMLKNQPVGARPTSKGAQQYQLGINLDNQQLLGFKMRNTLLSNDLRWYTADKIKGYVNDIVKGTAVGVGAYYGIKH